MTSYFVHSPLGLFHFLTSLLAMVAGTMVLLGKKGTQNHKRAGYFYIATMMLVCGSAMGIYRLTGRFGIFHVSAIVGFMTIACGMIPMFRKNLQRQYKSSHIWFMYYSVLGLYAAFVAELSVRIPNSPFYPMVGIATAVIMILGTIFILRKEKVWMKHFIDEK